MRKDHTAVLTATLITLVSVRGAVAQPGGIGAPKLAEPALEFGTQELRFSGGQVTFHTIRFLAKGYESVGTLSPAAATAGLVQGAWTQAGGTFKLSGDGSIRCRIPETADALELKYVFAPGHFDPVPLRLNGSQVELLALSRNPRQCLIMLRHEGDQVTFAGEPQYNLWGLQQTTPGPRRDEVHRSLDLSPGHDPVSAHGYTARIQFVARPEAVRSPAADAYVDLYGFDTTGFDGYVVSVKSTDASYFSTSVGDTNNFSWAGAGRGLSHGQWTSLAVPFEVHRNYTTAGDGVLKLAQLTRLSIRVGGRPADAPLAGEYLVRQPYFYKGEPPEGVAVAEKPQRSVCAVRTLAPERRQPHFFPGTSIQAFCRQGDAVWLGTDRGLIKNSLSQPGLEMARYSLPEGLIDDDVQCLHADGDSLWIGTTCGLSRFDGKEFHNYSSKDGLLPGPVMAITSDDNNVWFAMARGLAKLDKSSGKLTSRKGHGGWAPESTGGQGVPVQEGRGVYADSIAVGLDGSVWHGAAGVTHSAASGQQMRHYLGTTTRVLLVHPVPEGVWYVGAHNISLMETEEGLSLQSYGTGGRQGIHGERHSAFITCAHPEEDAIWLGYSDGVGWFSPKEKKCHWSPLFSVAMGSLVPQSIFADSRNVWVGTDNGLMVFPKSRAGEAWNSLEYSAPADLWAAGVDLDPELVECGDLGEFGRGAFSVTLDDEAGAPGSPGALLLQFNLGQQATSRAVMRQQFDMPLRGASAISFCAKTDDKPRDFFVDVRVNVKQGGATRGEVWRAKVGVGPQWKRFTVPFSQMRLVGGSGRGRPLSGIDAIHLTGVDFSRSVGEFHCPGDMGKLWVDALTWKTGRELRAEAGTRAAS